MGRFTYTGQGNFYLRAGDEVLSTGDDVELDEIPSNHEDVFERSESEDGSDGAESDSEGAADVSPSEDADSAEKATEAAENDEGEKSVDAPFNPEDFTIAQLEAELESSDFSVEELEALRSTEEAGDNRDGANDVIADAISDIE